jgi:hypothetical protein
VESHVCLGILSGGAIEKIAEISDCRLLIAD